MIDYICFDLLPFFFIFYCQNITRGREGLIFNLSSGSFFLFVLCSTLERIKFELWIQPWAQSSSAT